MARKKKSNLPNIEILILLVLLFSFISFAVVRCNKTKASYQEEEAQAQNVDAVASKMDSKKTIQEEAKKVVSTDVVENKATNSIVTKEAPVATTPTEPTVVSRLYVTLEDLNLRTGPHLDSTVLTKLNLFEEVFFMNAVTDFTQTISLGPETATEPWVKVRSRKGHVGWVYGAGVNYYRKRRLPDPNAKPYTPPTKQ